MKTERHPVFLERATYHKRRMADAARLLPVLGVILLGLPMLWLARADAATEAALTSHVMGYIFGVWVLLVGLSALLSAHLAAQPDQEDDEKGA